MKNFWLITIALHAMTVKFVQTRALPASMNANDQDGVEGEAGGGDMVVGTVAMHDYDGGVLLPADAIAIAVTGSAWRGGIHVKCVQSVLSPSNSA